MHRVEQIEAQLESGAFLSVVQRNKQAGAQTTRNKKRVEAVHKEFSEGAEK